MAKKKSDAKKVLVKVRSIAYFDQKKVVVNIPAKFDLDDRRSTQTYYDAWKLNKGLPFYHPLHDQVELMKLEFRPQEMMLTSIKGMTNVSIVIETSKEFYWITDRLSKVFGRENITFNPSGKLY